MHAHISKWGNINFIDLFTLSRFLFRASLRLKLIHDCDGNALIAKNHRNFLGGNVLNRNALECGVEIIYYRKMENPL